MKKSELFTIHFTDVVKGFITAVGTAILMGVQQAVAAVPPHFPVTWAEWQPILMAAVGGGIAYVLKNWLTNSNDQFLKKEKK